MFVPHFGASPDTVTTIEWWVIKIGSLLAVCLFVVGALVHQVRLQSAAWTRKRRRKVKAKSEGADKSAVNT